MADNCDLNTLLSRVLRAQIGVGQITLEDHKKVCPNGCAMCEKIVAAEAKLREKVDLEAQSGLTGTQVLALRYQFSQAEDSPASIIHSLYPSHDDIRRADNSLDPDVYLVIKLKDDSITDQDICNYFSINAHTWQNFKKTNFPNWKTSPDDYLSGPAIAAYKRYKLAHKISRKKAN